jgi:mono/diheme cytochrome c family protein
LLIAAGVTALIAAGSESVTGQTFRQAPPSVIPSLYGGDLFRFYCSSCHGREGKGDGPVVSSLRRPPPDLTTIATRHDGRFPREAIERFVSGEADPALAHGSREMPVWGPIFYALDPNDTLTRVRIANIVAFIESIQVK